MVIHYRRPASTGLGLPGSLPPCHVYISWLYCSFLDG